jgi:glycosyltransferase involved in cell wall biosynthesis
MDWSSSKRWPAASPVVVTDHGGASEVVTDRVDGLLVAAGDVLALADAIERLLGDPDGRLAMGLAARKESRIRIPSEDYGAFVLSTIRDRLAQAT